MKSNSVKKAVRKAYQAPKLVVYGKVSELTQTGGGGRGERNGGGGRGKHGRGGRGRGHGGSRS